jgi:hypothetical protein
VILLQLRTVAKLDFYGSRCAQMDPVFGQVVVDRRQLVEVAGDLGDRLGELRAVVGLERLDRPFA